jgi:ComF family protein
MLFPTQCVCCEKREIILCKDCFSSIKILNIQKCPCCERSVTEAGELCSTCKQTDYPLKRILVASDYKDSHLPHLVHLYKYRFVTNLHNCLGEILLNSLSKYKIEIPELLIPVPLHSFRLRWRGFNQAELLAKQIGENLIPGIKIEVSDDIIKRTKYSPPQMKIKKYSERQENISGAFSIDLKLKNKIRGKKILLVDDICTTGSTLIECAKVLKKFNPRSISAIVLARQS